TYQTDDEPMDVLDVLNTPNTQEAPYIEVMRPPSYSPSPTLSICRGSWTIPASENWTDFTIDTNQPFESILVTSNKPSWLTISGIGSTRTLNVLVNDTGEKREAIVTVSVAGLSRLIYVTQMALDGTIIAFDDIYTNGNVRFCQLQFQKSPLLPF
ncbi:MAG: hypothetical protein FWB74_09555, partial [Defluviitaleaceae bacterium]|nr:hypothetical protein [Defluviitaleaceae bacterium]